jgi:D-glycero-alpha-D-manno-heptose-7-phosphate kinase
MIISSAPFRISFAGGGSDIGFFYRKRRGAILSTAIDKYIYISIHPYFNARQTLLKYSRNELINDLAEIQHPVFREVLKELWPEGGLEIVSTADIPSGTGLGSSSSFTVALLHAIYAYRGTFCGKEKLASRACEIEIDRLGEPIGKQDQYAAAYGGLNFIEFNPDDSVAVTPLILPRDTLVSLEKNLLLFYTGEQRATGEVLEDQKRVVESSQEKFRNLSRMSDLAYEMRELLVAGDLEGFARVMDEGWELKRTLSGRISNGKIDDYYDRALKNGARGGKLLGAGGGGFLLFYSEPENQEQLRKALSDLPELPFKFDWSGSRIIYVGDVPTKKGFIP